MSNTISRQKKLNEKGTSALGFEAMLWPTADKSCGTLDTIQFKHIGGLVFESLLSEFTSAEGKKGGQFYTPRSVVQLLVEMLAPYKGRVFAPSCGSGGMFVQSVEFVKAHANGNGNISKAKGDISIFGQESNPGTWLLVRLKGSVGKCRTCSSDYRRGR